MNEAEKQIWFSQAGRDWDFKRIKAIVTTNDGGVWGDDSFDDSGVGVLRSNEITKEGAWDITDPAFRSLSKNEATSRRLNEGDLLIVKSSGSETHIGKTAIVNSTVAEMGYCFSNFTQRLTPTKHHLKSRFLWYILNNSPGRDQLFYFGTTTTGLINLSGSNIGRVIAPLPPLAEQQRIAAYLDASCAAIDRAVETKRKQLETLDALRKSIIQKAVTQGLNPKVKMKDSGVEWLGPVPSNWEVARIKKHTEMIRGKFSHRPRNDPALYDGPYPFFQTGSIARADKYITEFKQTLNEDGLAVSRMFPKGIVVMSIAANVGDVAITGFEGCFPDSIVGFIPDHHTHTDFLYYLLKSMKQVMLSSAILTTQLNLNYVRIGANYCAFPPKSEQEKIANFLDAKMDELRKVASVIDFQLTTLTAYRKSLIHECVTGKRRISDADVAKVEAHV